jgi:replicative DNA helicase
MHTELPYNLDAEKAVLGSVLLNRDVFPELTPMLQPGMFYLERHAHIFAAMLACYTARIPPDTRMVSEELRQHGQLDAVGGVAYLSDLIDWTPTSAHALHYAAIVLNTWVQRQGIVLGSTIAQLAYQTPTADALHAKIHAAVAQHMTGTASAADMRDLGGILWELQGEFTSPQRPAISTGLCAYDRATDGGLWPGELVVPASRPGQGKSTFVGTIAANVAANGGRVDVFSLEMEYKEIARRLLAAESGIDSRVLRRRELDTSHITHLVDVIMHMEKWPLRLDSARTTVEAIRSKVLRGIAEHGPIALVIVDYIQLVRSSGAYKGNRVAEIGEIAHQLKDLAMEAQCTVMAPAQMSRAIENRADAIPTLSDLRESGDIENDADKVLFMVRPDMMTNSKKKPVIDAAQYGEGFSPLLIYKAKDRSGPICEITDLMFDARHNRIVDMDRTRTPEGY